MARDHARLKLAIWRDTEFTARSVDAKFLYFSLLCAPKLSWCGSLDYSPKQLATLDESYNATKVRRVIKELVAHRYVLVDDKTDEIAIRSFIRHDGVLNSPNVAKAMGKAISSLLSPQIRDGLVAELGRLHDEVPEAKGWQPFAEGFPDLYAQVVAKGSVNPSVRGSTKGLPNPSSPRARASRALSPSPLPLPLPTTSGGGAAAPGDDVEVAPPDSPGGLIKFWCDLYDVEPLPKVRTHIAREIREIHGKVPADVIREACRRLVRNPRDVGPSALQHFVLEASNTGQRTAAKTNHQQATDAIFGGAEARAQLRMGANQ